MGKAADGYVTPPPALPKLERTKAKIPTAADMIIPTDASVNPVQTFVNRVDRVALPAVPRSMPVATVCKFAAMIKAIKTTITNAVMAMMSEILTRLTSQGFVIIFNWHGHI